MGKATAKPALSLLAQASALLAKLAQESEMNVWLHVHQSLEKDGVSGVIPNDKVCDILIGGINLLKIADLLDQWVCKLKDEILDRLNMVLVGNDVRGLWALLKDTLGTARETGSIYKGEPPLNIPRPVV